MLHTALISGQKLHFVVSLMVCVAPYIYLYVCYGNIIADVPISCQIKYFVLFYTSTGNILCIVSKLQNADYNVNTPFSLRDHEQ